MAECDLLAANIGSCSDTTSKGFATIGYVGNHSQATPTLNLSTGLVTNLLRLVKFTRFIRRETTLFLI